MTWWPGRAAAGVRGGRAAEHQRRRRSAPRRRRRARPPTCPGRSASSCRTRSARCAPRSRRAARGAIGPSRPGWAKKYGMTSGWPGSSGQPGGRPRPPTRRRGSRAAPRSCTASSAASGCAVARDDGMAGALELGADRVRPRRQLDRRRPDAEPDLRARLVPPVRVAPHERDRVGHGAASLHEDGQSLFRIVAHVRPAPPPVARACASSGCGSATLEAGPANAITDVAGVQVGHVTVWRDEPGGRGSRAPA